MGGSSRGVPAEELQVTQQTWLAMAEGHEVQKLAWNLACRFADVLIGGRECSTITSCCGPVEGPPRGGDDCLTRGADPGNIAPTTFGDFGD